MNRNAIAKLLVCAAAFAAALPLVADTEWVNGIKWTYRAYDTWEVELVPPAVPTSTKGAVEVPSLLGGKNVSRIASSAFSGCRKLSSVTLPIRRTLFSPDTHNCHQCLRHNARRHLLTGRARYAPAMT